MDPLNPQPGSYRQLSGPNPLSLWTEVSDLHEVLFVGFSLLGWYGYSAAVDDCDCQLFMTYIYIHI